MPNDCSNSDNFVGISKIKKNALLANKYTHIWNNHNVLKKILTAHEENTLIGPYEHSQINAPVRKEGGSVMFWKLFYCHGLGPCVCCVTAKQ